MSRSRSSVRSCDRHARPVGGGTDDGPGSPLAAVGAVLAIPCAYECSCSTAVGSTHVGAGPQRLTGGGVPAPARRRDRSEDWVSASPSMASRPYRPKRVISQFLRLSRPRHKCLPGRFQRLRGERGPLSSAVGTAFVSGKLGTTRLPGRSLPSSPSLHPGCIGSSGSTRFSRHTRGPHGIWFRRRPR